MKLIHKTKEGQQLGLGINIMYSKGGHRLYGIGIVIPTSKHNDTMGYRLFALHTYYGIKFINRKGFYYV